MKKLIIAGGSGLIGKALTKFFTEKNYEVVILSRAENQSAYDNIRFVKWNGKTVEPLWQQELEGAEAVINLCGKSINCRFTATNKKELLLSRIDSTKAIGTAISICKNPPKVWFNSSSIAIYKYSETILHDEFSTQFNQDFLSEITHQWENAVHQFLLSNTRKIVMRTSLVMAKNDGVFLRLKRLTQFGLGGKQGSGSQLISWIHVNDFCKIIEYLLENKNANGVYNFCAPHPIANKNLMKTIQQKLKMPIALPAFEWMIKLGALLIGMEPDLILQSSNVASKRLMDAGFEFIYHDFKSAINVLNS